MVSSRGCGGPAPLWGLTDEDSRKGAESSGPYRGAPSPQFCSLGVSRDGLVTRENTGVKAEPVKPDGPPLSHHHSVPHALNVESGSSQEDTEEKFSSDHVTVLISNNGQKQTVHMKNSFRKITFRRSLSGAVCCVDS